MNITMDMSFKEKSTWISLFSTVLIFGYYFINLIGLTELPDAQAKTAAGDLLMRAVILSVVVEIIFQGMLAATNHQAASLGDDERYKYYQYKANNIAYSILVTGVLVTLGRILFLEFNPAFDDHDSSLNIPLLTAHILMFSFILSEVVRFSCQLYYYRKGT